MVAWVSSPVPLPELPAYDPDQALSVGTACRLGLIPGHDGRRALPAEVRSWAQTGFAVSPFGPRYLFPAVRVGGLLYTTVPWGAAWVRCIAAMQAGDRLRRERAGLRSRPVWSASGRGG